MKQEIENAARNIAKDVFESEYGKDKKAQVWVCGLTKLSSSKKAKCHFCKRVCYYDTKLKSNFKKDHIKICLNCALDKGEEFGISNFQRRIIEGAIKGECG